MNITHFYFDDQSVPAPQPIGPIMGCNHHFFGGVCHYDSNRDLSLITTMPDPGYPNPDGLYFSVDMPSEKSVAAEDSVTIQLEVSSKTGTTALLSYNWMVDGTVVATNEEPNYDFGKFPSGIYKLQCLTGNGSSSVESSICTLIVTQ